MYQYECLFIKLFKVGGASMNIHERKGQNKQQTIFSRFFLLDLKFDVNRLLAEVQPYFLT